MSRAARPSADKAADDDLAPAEAPERFFGVRPRRAIGESVIVAALAWAWTTILYRLWNFNPHVPIYQDYPDARQIANVVQNIVTRGWYPSNPHLGAPFGQQLYDVPQGGESFQLFIIKFLSLFTHSYGLIINLYFLGGFGLTAAITYLVLRHLRFSAVVAAAISLLFVLLPFHFSHEESHLFRTSYWFVPIACLILVWAMQWRERFLIDPHATGHGGAWQTLRWTVTHNLRRRRVLFMAAICVLLGCTETMTTCFTMVLLALVGLIGALRKREPARLLVTGLVIGVIGATFVLSLYPTIHFDHAYGANKVAARRLPIEQERYGLKISAMVLPTGAHRWAPIANFSKKAERSSPIPSEDGQSLTVLGTIGFFSALFWLVARGWGRGKPDGEDDQPPHDRVTLLDNGALIVFIATLVGTVSGLALVLSVIGFSEVRVWNRIVLIIAFFSFAFTGHWFEKLARWTTGKLTWPIPIFVVLCLAVGAFGLWDGGKPVTRNYKALEADYNSDHVFVSWIEHKMPKGTDVFEFPVVPFPETPPPGKMVDYDELRPFLASNGSTNWSYGSVKGRPNADWQLIVLNKLGPLGSLVPLLGMGFTGIYVDTFGYSDGGALIRSQLTTALGVEPHVSPNGRELFYDMRPYERRLGMTADQLRAAAKNAFNIAPPTGK